MGVQVVCIFLNRKKKVSIYTTGILSETSVRDKLYLARKDGATVAVVGVEHLEWSISARGVPTMEVQVRIC